MAVAEDTGGYYALVSNHGSPYVPSVPPSVVLYRFGKSLLNNPTSQSFGNLGNIVPEHIEGVQLKNDNGHWYGFIIGGIDADAKLIRLDFGNSLENVPISKDMGSFNKSLDYPVDLYMFKENGLWVGYSANYSVNTDDGYITRFEFGASLGNIPTVTNINNLGLHHPCGICVVADQGTWYMFVTNLGSSSITRLTLGSSLFNNPVKVEQFENVQVLDSPFDITITRDCDQIYGFTVNRYGNDLVRLDFPDGLGGSIRFTPLGNIGNLYNPHGLTEIFRVDNEIFTFVANADNSTLSRLYYQTCMEPSILTSTHKDPLPLYYRREGNYNITLITDQGLPTEKSMCKNIVVIEKPKLTLPNDTTICPAASITLGPVGSQTRFYRNNWSTMDTSMEITLPPRTSTDSIWLEVTNNRGCKGRDTVIVSRYPDNLFLGNDTAFTIGEPIYLDAGNGYRVYTWSTGDNTSRITAIKPGDYAIAVTDYHGCILTDTIRLTLAVTLPNFFTPNGDGINDVWEPKLFVHYPEAEIKIVDRFGKLMASYRGNQHGWDGTYNSRLADANTYWYVVDLKNGIKPLTGQITIKR